MEATLNGVIKQIEKAEMTKPNPYPIPLPLPLTPNPNPNQVLLTFCVVLCASQVL